MDSISLSTEKQSYRDEYMRRKKKQNSNNHRRAKRLENTKNEKREKWTQIQIYNQIK